MQDLLPIPSCFYSGQKPMSSTATDHPNSTKKVGQSAVMSAYRTRMDGHDRTVTVTWCRSILGMHGLSVSVEPGPDDEDDDIDKTQQQQQQYNSCCRVEMRPWSFWRRHGSKRLHVVAPAGGTRPVDVFWDLRSAKYSEELAEPVSEYYVAVVCVDEVVLLLGNLKKDAFLRTGSRPSIFDAALVSKKEHVFGRKRFSTGAAISGKFRAIVISIVGSTEMVIEIDGDVGVEVKHLQWKFRGNDSISVSDEVKVEVYWDVHDWLFSPGLTHALFIFKPLIASPAAPSSNSDFCLFLYAWKLE